MRFIIIIIIITITTFFSLTGARPLPVPPDPNDPLLNSSTPYFKFKEQAESFARTQARRNEIPNVSRPAIFGQMVTYKLIPGEHTVRCIVTDILIIFKLFVDSSSRVLSSK